MEYSYIVTVVSDEPEDEIHDMLWYDLSERQKDGEVLIYTIERVKKEN